MATLSSIITPSNVETASSTSTLTNKTISGSSNTITNVPLSTAVTGTLPIANGGTGTSSTTFANLTTNVTGTLPVANGGTGAASLTANNVLLGNGTSAVQVVAPGSSGNVLTSNGTTWQSTAPAPSGGSVTATASGSIANGAPVIVNSDGTVSAITATAGSSSTITSANVNASVYPALGGYGGYGTVVYGSSTGAVVAFYVGSVGANRYVYASIGSVSGSSYTWSTPFAVYSAPCGFVYSGGYDSANNRYWCTVRDTSSYGVFVGVTLNSQGAYLNAVSTGLSSFAGDIVDAFTMSVNADGTKGIFSYNANSYQYLMVHGFSFSSGAPYITQGNSALASSSFNTYSNDSKMMISINSDGSRGICFFYNSSSYPTCALIGITSNNASLLSTSVIQSVSSASPTGVSYSSVDDKFVAVWGVNSPSWDSKAATITVSGSSMSFGTVLTGGLPYPYNSVRDIVYSRPINKFMVFGTTNSNSLTISGTTLTAGSGVSFSGTSSGNTGGWTAIDDLFSQIMWISGAPSSAFYMQVTIARPYTSTLTAQNLLGVSDASYTNGQTATVKIVGSTKSGLSGLTAGTKYNASGAGSFQPVLVPGGQYIGVALSSSSLLVKG